MKIESVSPLGTSRQSIYEDLKDSACPTIMLSKEFDITPVVRYSKRNGMKLNMLLCWLIGRAASDISEFYALYDNHLLHRYDTLSLNVVVDAGEHGIFLCDVPYSASLPTFAADYDRICGQAIAERRNILSDEHARVGTSAVVQTELSFITGGYNEKYTNPFLTWGRYHRGWLRATLPITMRVHHIQMDGGHCARFMANLENAIRSLRLFTCDGTDGRR